jgi:hypothetical protein
LWWMVNVKMNILNTAKIRFNKNKTGSLNITLEDNSTVKDVHCIRLFPLSEPGTFISVVHHEDGRLREVGVIRKLKELTGEQQRLVRDDIKLRYFVPEIKDINKITARHGLYEWDVVTGRGNKKFSLRSIRENIAVNDEGMIIITDLERCRYKITDYERLPAKARAELDKVLL